jgi:hypothetical protein
VTGKGRSSTAIATISSADTEPLARKDGSGAIVPSVSIDVFRVDRDAAGELSRDF